MKLSKWLPVIVVLVAPMIPLDEALEVRTKRCSVRDSGNIEDAFARALHRPQAAANRISGGYLARDGSVPFFVTIRVAFSEPVTSKAKNQEIYCGGVIIGKNLILTAAVCLQFQDPEPEIRVKASYAGYGHGFNLNSSDTYVADTMCVGTKRATDFAVIRLQEPKMKFNSLVGRVHLPSRQIRFSEEAFAAGAGFENSKRRYASGAKILPVKRAKCTTSAELSPKRYMCFRANTKKYPGAPCIGDTGGPVYTSQGSRYYLHGLILADSEDCEPKTSRVAIYANVYDQLTNIRKLMESCANAPIGDDDDGDDDDDDWEEDEEEDLEPERPSKPGHGYPGR